jgi:UDP-3-O-[3-hydroxymyristoyl] glucosamine N-acyltransferase
MKLSELKIGEMLNDSEFNWLGLTADKYENRKVLTFLNDEKYIPEVIKNETIFAIITKKEIIEKNIELKNKYGIIISENPKKDFFLLHNRLVKEDFYYPILKNKISTKAVISKSACIGEYNVEIADNVIIEDNVTIYSNSIIKENSIIRAGSTIGGNGFEFSKFNDEVLAVIPGGKVIIDKNVEIQNNNCIDRGIFSNTYIGENVKTDNLVHIAHDVVIGKNTFIIACVFLGGRVVIGDNSYIGPNCTVKNGLKIGNNSKVSMGSVVTKNVADNEVVTGNFAIPHNKFLKAFKHILGIIGE